MLDVLIPEGPLHPELAIAGLGVGLLCAALAGRRHGLWFVLLPVATLAIVGERLGNVVIGSYVERSDTLFALGLTAAVVVLSAVRPLRVSTSVGAALGATAGVWAVVPDTEVPLLAGAVIVGALAVAPRDIASRFSPLVLVMPIAAAVAGSVGRIERLSPALMVSVLGAALALAVVETGRQLLRQYRLARVQRAGTPTTVAPGATSSTTTAPAPTTAP